MRIISLILTILSLFSLAGCNEAEVPPDESIKPAVYQKISAAEAYKMMAEENVIILDVRTDDEHRENRIDDAILIPDYEIKNRAEIELPDKNSIILVYCRSGRRSENAATTLISMGYSNVYDFGGITDWPYETVTDNI